MPILPSEQVLSSTLIAAAHASHRPILLAIPTRRDASWFERELRVRASEVVEWKHLGLSVQGTPMVVFLDQRNDVRALWIGMMGAKEETAALEILETNNFSTFQQSSMLPERNFSEAELDHLARTTFNLINVQDRTDAYDASREMRLPISELALRSSFELDRDKLQIVDCSRIVGARCAFATKILEEKGFKVATLNAGTYRRSCKTGPIT